MMVQEPQLPTLWELPAVSFDYSVYMANTARAGGIPGRGAGLLGGFAYTSGSVAVALRSGEVRLSARGTEPGSANVSLAMEPGLLAVQVQPTGAGKPVCASLPVPEGSFSRAANITRADAPAAVFDGVEDISGTECNRFTFPVNGPRAETVEFWFAPEEQQVCQIMVLPPAGSGDASAAATISLPSWKPAYLPGAGLASAPSSWSCAPASAVPWLSAGPGPKALARHTMPAARALAKVAEASGAVGLLTPEVSTIISRLVIADPFKFVNTPTSTTTPPVPQPGIFAPELEAFSFSYTSTRSVSAKAGAFVSGKVKAEEAALRPEELRANKQAGEGELRVDLVGRRLYLRSEAHNLSSGLPLVESRVIYRGDRGRLYARTRIASQDFEQCWTVRTAEFTPASDGEVPPSPNPFVGGRLLGRGFSAPGAGPQDEPAEKYVLWLEQKKLVELFVRGKTTLAAIGFVDQGSLRSSRIAVKDWSTAPIDSGWFEPSNDWKCSDLQFLESAAQLAGWDFLRFFLPPVEPADRRLLRV